MRVIDWGTGIAPLLNDLPFVSDVTIVSVHEQPSPSDAARANAIVVRSGPQLTAAVIGTMPELRVVVRPGSGYDNIDVEALEAAGIELVRVQADGGAVADLAIGLTIDCLRGVTQHGRALAAGRWTKLAPPHGREVSDERVAIIGFGRVGQSVARRLGGWCNTLLLVDRSASNPAKRALAEQLGARFVAKDEALRSASVVVLSLPLAAETRHWLGPAELATMAPGAVIVNVARAAVVDLDALLDALANNHVAAAGLDVHLTEAAPDHPLYTHPAVVAVPHIGAQTAMTRRRLSEAVIAALQAHATELCEVTR